MSHIHIQVVILVYILICIPFKDENFWYYFVKWFTKTFFRTNEIGRQIAMAHTLMPLLKGFIMLPLLPMYGKLLCKLFPVKEEEKPFGPIYISDTLLDSPSLALAQAKKEVIRTAEIVEEMLRNTLKVFEEQNLQLAEQVSLTDIKVDILRNAIVPYLTKIGKKTLSDEEAKLEVSLLYCINEIEAIGDIIDKNILPLARKKLLSQLWFSDEGWNDIVSLHNKVYTNLSCVITALKNDDSELARKIAETKPVIGRYESELRMKHIERLHAGLKESLETSAIHFDLIDQYKRINSHIASIGYIILGQL